MTDLILSWRPDGTGAYVWSRWLARKYPASKKSAEGWRLYENGEFRLSAATPGELEIYVLGRMEAEHRKNRERFSKGAAE